MTKQLGLTGDTVQPGYEDTWYYLWRERRLPVNVDPFDSRLDDELERARLRRLFDQGLEREVGYVLPLKRGEGPALGGPRWITGPWFFRDERMYLFPGDSPMGYRLPLDSLPWVSKGDYPYHVEADPFAPRGASAAQRRRSAASTRRMRSAAASPRAARWRCNARWPAGRGLGGRGGEPRRCECAATLSAARCSRRRVGQPAATPRPWRARRALRIRALGHPHRAGGRGARSAPRQRPQGRKPSARPSSVLYVFMPPLQTLEDYLELLAAVEATAASLGVKIVLEGYPPPRDPRLKMLQVTPDPGVIEVNIHPAHNWRELVEHTEFLYDAAWQSRLSTEKFMLDGRHTGTGGGNHFVLGGATPADSPFLRRPDLLG